ncbi:hypothetical protein T11_13120 [Trichinella zimbabwensis]|uniref:Uncharacterized protein n=1 Tax=Trichinella zimbabwensis TaxID=268475 RepID=A0A0V1GG45_9BILA|nr:hypothetical protein T11_13120 [Trichinella zimbabwensis]
MKDLEKGPKELKGLVALAAYVSEDGLVGHQ